MKDKSNKITFPYSISTPPPQDEESDTTNATANPSDMLDFDINLLEDESVISSKPKKDEEEGGSTGDNNPTM